MISVNYTGAYRLVILLGEYAIKLPRIGKLAEAMRCNRWENEMWEVWRPIYGWENLCPIHYSDPCGFISVMARADQPVCFKEIVEHASSDQYDYYPDIAVEYKPENWGKIGEKIVCLDYGLDDSESVDKRRAYYEEKKDQFGVT